MSAWSSAVAAVDEARARGDLSAGAAVHIRSWLTEPRYAPYAGLVAEQIAAGRWRELDDAFWTVIPFGTAGRRGRMYPIGTNAINERTIGESAQGLADYVRATFPDVASPGCAIAYDTRHRSRPFAELCAEVMAAAGFQVYFLDGHRSTPALAFAVRHKQCVCGMMISASHNPPTDNAVKVFWQGGGQLKPPHDAGVIARVACVEAVVRQPFAQALAAGRIECCQDEIDAAYGRAVLAAGFAGPRELRIVYSPLHGVGLTSVLPALRADGFTDVEVYAPHAAPDGDFPNVPDHVANPENAAVFDAIAAYAESVGAELALASDPDADRLGCSAPLVPSGEWRTLNGNQIGVLLADYVLDRLQASGQLTPEHYLVKTLVTTDMVARLGESYGVRTYGDVLTGFKWIGGVIDERGPEKFVFGFEEAHGYLAGTHIRDKDGAVAGILMAELAARAKTRGRTVHQELERLYRRVGWHAEKTVALTMPGADGMARMAAMMARLRGRPPESIGGLGVIRLRDYERGVAVVPGLPGHEPLEGPAGDVLVFDLALPGHRAAVRPSGTEPKIKFYFFAQTADGDTQAMHARLERMAADLAHE